MADLVGHTLAYRIECPKDGFGPYKSERDEKLGDELSDAHRDREHPVPSSTDNDWPCKMERILQMLVADAVCGCTSLRALKEWFSDSPDWLVYLKDAGFVVASYSVPNTDIEIGKYQCVFLRDNATRSRVMWPSLLKA